MSIDEHRTPFLDSSPIISLSADQQVPLQGNFQNDVVIAGGVYTDHFSALALHKANPSSLIYPSALQSLRRFRGLTVLFSDHGASTRHAA